MHNVGVFTTIKVINGVPLFFNKHHTRLIKHANTIHITPPQLSITDIRKYLQTYNLTDCALKLILQNVNSQPVVTMEHRALPDAVTTINAITRQDTRDALKTVKTTNRTVNNQAKTEAEKRGATDALFVQHGMLIESTIANIFSIDETGQIITPPLNKRGLQGIMRQVIMEQTSVLERDIPENTTGPLVLVNSLRIQKIATLNGKELHNSNSLCHKIQSAILSARKL